VNAEAHALEHLARLLRERDTVQDYLNEHAFSIDKIHVEWGVASACAGYHETRRLVQEHLQPSIRQMLQAAVNMAQNRVDEARAALAKVST
jgi:hypothetical protein